MKIRRLLILLFSLYMIAWPLLSFLTVQFSGSSPQVALPLVLLFVISWIGAFIAIPLEARSQGENMPLWGFIGFLLTPFAGIAIVVLGMQKDKKGKQLTAA